MERVPAPEETAQATARDEIARALGPDALARLTVSATVDEENADALQLSLRDQEGSQDGATLLLGDATSATAWENTVRQAVHQVLARMGLLPSPNDELAQGEHEPRSARSEDD